MTEHSCRCGPSWLAVNSCACRKTPKGVSQRDTVPTEPNRDDVRSGARNVQGARLGEDGNRGETQQTKITRPTRHLVIEGGRVREVSGWHRKL